jgi:hypothetical protein
MGDEKELSSVLGGGGEIPLFSKKAKEYIGSHAGFETSGIEQRETSLNT